MTDPRPTPPVGPAARLPRAGGGWTWALAAAVVVGTLGGAEAFWRGRGLTPSVTDSRALWAAQRDRVDGFDPAEARRAVVLAGASRMHLGFSADVFRRRHPGRPLVQLAIDGTAPGAVVHDLAEDPRFRGTLLVSVSQNHLGSANRTQALPYVEYRSRRGPLERFSFAVGRRLGERLVVLREGLDPLALITRLKQRRPVVPVWHRPMRPDRTSRLVVDAPDPAFVEKQRRFAAQIAGGGRQSAEVWGRAVADLERDVRAVQARGGRVVFVRFPSTGPVGAAERTLYPRAENWDRLAAGTSAVAVHCDDLPCAGGLVCPDFSHLDAASADVFTAALLDELERRGVL